MCIQDPKSIIAELEKLVEAQRALESWQADLLPDGKTAALEVTQDEGRRLLETRIADTETRIKRMGFTGPVVPADRGDSVRIGAQR